MRTFLALALLPLAACGVTVRPSCEVVEEVDLADDEVSSLGITPDALLAMVAGDHVVAGTSAGAEVNVEVGVTRGEGPARLVRRGSTSIRTPNGNLFGEDYLFIAVSCDDVLSVPVGLRVATDDGAVEFDEAAELVSVQGGSQGDVSVWAEVAADEVEGVPLPEEAVTVHADARFLNVHPDASEQALLSGGLRWSDDASSGNLVAWEGALAR